MKIAIVNLGNIYECFVSSFLNKVLQREHPNSSIEWFVKNEDCKSLFRFNKNIPTHIPNYKTKFNHDIIINLNPSFESKNLLGDKEVIGFNFKPESNTHYNIIFGKKKTDKNIFQSYCNLIDYSWRGESYDIRYFPKSRSKKNRAGLAISHIGLRKYIINKLDLKETKTWTIPYRSNIFKKMDEINQCKFIITDDLMVMHIAVFLRKYVHFLDTYDYNMKIEFFNQGQVYPVPNTVYV